MKRAIAADLVLTFHFLFVAFAVFGGFLALLDWRYALVHVPAVAWSSIVNLAHWTCPLTPLEKSFRRQAGEAVFEGGCIVHYVAPLVRPFGMPRTIELVAGVSILTWNVVVYSIVFWRIGGA